MPVRLPAMGLKRALRMPSVLDIFLPDRGLQWLLPAGFRISHPDHFLSGWARRDSAGAATGLIVVTVFGCDGPPDRLILWAGHTQPRHVWLNSA